MVFGKLLGQFSKKTILAREIRGNKAMRGFDLEAAYFQISSAIIAHRDLRTILDLVVRESLNCLRANRSSIFFIGPKSGTLRAQFIHALNPRYEKAGLVEEKQVAKKTLMQGKSFFLQEAKDFAEFFESRERGWKVSSLLSIPLSSQGKPVGALSVVLINEKRRFSARDLKYLFFFGNLASLAMENAHLMEELNKEISSRKTFEQCLDNILGRMQGLFGKEGWHNEEHLENSLPVQIATQYRPFGNQTGKKVNWVDSSLILAGK
jgi:transcriptional regulator with GAF, ATPase, and Fis domain